MSVRRAQELLKESRAVLETEVWGLGRRSVGFGETKCGVWGDEVWGLGRRKKPPKINNSLFSPLLSEARFRVDY
jgi:hypothetical protein